MDNHPTETLRALIRANMPDLVGGISFQPIESGYFNSTYFVHASRLDRSRRELVLRVAPADDAEFVFYEAGMMKQEPEIHSRLLEHTRVPVPRILAFDESRDLIDRDYMIMERLPGRPLSEASTADAEAVLRRVGSLLARVHAQTADRYGYLGAHHPMEPQATWAEAFAVMWLAMIADVERMGYYSADESAMMGGLLDRHMHVFERTVPASLLHMDVWGPNIIVAGEREVTGLLDWDRALWGDPEMEFAVLDYCGVSEPPFWEGYGRRRDRSDEANTRRAFYLLYEVQKYIVIYHGRNGDPATAERYKQNVAEFVRREFG